MAGREFPYKGDITIGNDVWLGYRSVILAGVTVGDGAIVGAYSVVTKDVPPYTIVAGNPAKEIRRRFAPAEIERLQELRHRPDIRQPWRIGERERFFSQKCGRHQCQAGILGPRDRDHAIQRAIALDQN